MDKKNLNEKISKDDSFDEKNKKWYEGKNKEIVIYYLIAVFFLEIIVGTAAFFYGVVHAEVQIEGGPKMASFPWVGWTITTILVPVFLLLLFHLSGWFFTRSLPNEGPAQRTEPGKETPIPKNVELVYSVISNAPVLVVLLGLIALGGALFVLDTALGTLRPYIPWILGSVTLFLIVCYIARLIFLAKHHKTEKEYAYRMQIFRETGVIITEKNLIPLTAEQIASAANALPEGHAKTEEPEAGENAGADTSRDDAHEDNIIDATIVEKEPKKP